MKTTIKLAVWLIFTLVTVSSAAEPNIWLKPYPQRQYGAFWHFEFEFQDLSNKKDKILSILSKYGGEATIPTSIMANTKAGDYQQISYRIQRKNAQKALSEFDKIGTMKSSSQKDNYDTVAERDAKDRLVRLKTELSANGAALKRMPALSELASEMTQTLQAAVLALGKSENVVLLDLILEEKEKGK